MGDSYNGFFDRSYDDFFEGTAYMDFLSAPRKPTSPQPHVPSRPDLTSTQDLANLQLPPPQRLPNPLPFSALPPVTGLMRNIGPPSFSAASSGNISSRRPSQHQNQQIAQSEYQTGRQPPFSPGYFDTQSPLQSGASAWQVGNGNFPSQQEQTGSNSISGPTLSVGASYRPTPTAASTFQRSDHPNLFRTTTNLLPSFNSNLNPPPEPPLPALAPLADDRASFANTAAADSLNSDHFLNELVSRDFSSPSIPSATPRPSLNTANDVLPLNLPSLNLSLFPPVSLRDPPPPSRDLRSVLGGDSDSDNPLTAMSSRARRVGARDSGVTLTLPESSSASTARRSSRTPHVSPIQKGNSSSAAKKRKRSESLGFGEEDYLDDVIDLVDKDAVPEEHRKQEKPKNYTRLRDFTCIICYEEATDLTVTFCGMRLFKMQNSRLHIC